MNVIVFGATGTVGKLAVSELLSAGHTVTAFRPPSRETGSRATPSLRITRATR
jgi:uncharacterized protein YbjT (DUF2867 family)